MTAGAIRTRLRDASGDARSRCERGVRGHRQLVEGDQRQLTGEQRGIQLRQGATE